MIVLICLSLNISQTLKTKPTTSSNINGIKILIDAGHGYPDGGAIGGTGIAEKDINLSIAKKLGKLFINGGALVYYTRTDDYSPAYNDNENIKKGFKTKDLKMRTDMIKKYKPDLFISIHMNKFSDSKYSGAQVFYDGYTQESQKLANSIQHSLKTLADETNNRIEKHSNGSIYILKNCNIPSVLVECGFLSNKAEEAKLLTDNYQNIITYAIYAGTMKYLEK